MDPVIGLVMHTGQDILDKFHDLNEVTALFIIMDGRLTLKSAMVEIIKCTDAIKSFQTERQQAQIAGRVQRRECKTPESESPLCTTTQNPLYTATQE